MNALTPANPTAGAMSGDITVRDTSHDVARPFEVTVHIHAQRIPGSEVRWEEPFFSENLTQELALADLPGWLSSQGDLRSFSRVEVATNTWLLWLRHVEDSTLCLQTRTEAPRCWREAGALTRVVPYGWTVPFNEPPAPTGYVGVFREDAGPVFWALRTHLAWSRAFARPQPLLAQVRPSWWPSPYGAEPIGEVAIPQWRGIVSLAPPDLGPLRWLKVKSLRVQGPARERQDSVIVARGNRHRIVCARQARWTCSDTLDTEDGGDPYLENEYLSALDIDGTSLALVRSARRPGDGSPGSQSGADAYLEVWEHHGAVAFKGSVHVGRASWSVEPGETAPLRRRVERVLHAVHIESDGCLRIDSAESDRGVTDVNFVASEANGPLNLARAGEALDFASDGPLVDLGGHWRLGDSGLTRVGECGSNRTRLVRTAIPPDLDPRAATCLALINERIDERPTLAPVSGNACGATQYRHGVIMGRHRFRYDGDRRVETLRVTRIQPRDASRYVERERTLWRRNHRAGYVFESMHFLDGEEECANSHWRRDTLDGQGRPTRIRLRSEPCEGEPRSEVESRTWRRGDGFDVETHDRADHFYLPTYADSAAEVTCSSSGCACEVDVRDEQGVVRVRLQSGDPSARLEYHYSCPAPPWPTTSEALGQLSVDANFEE